MMYVIGMDKYSDIRGLSSGRQSKSFSDEGRVPDVIEIINHIITQNSRLIGMLEKMSEPTIIAEDLK